MKNNILVLLVLGMLVPMLSFAQVDTDPNPPVSDCVIINNNLRYKDRDINKNGEISTLQDYLQTSGYLNSEPTGFFGLLTLRAVKDFQKSNGISPTGYVGVVTRSKIQSLSCGYIPTPIPTPINTNNPVISGVSGPQNLLVGQEGTWKISASDASGTNLSYSVIWGDESQYSTVAMPNIYHPTIQNLQNSTFTHTYYKPGNYSPKFTVTRENTIYCITTPCPGNGGSASTSLSVKVSPDANKYSITVLSPNGGDVIGQGQSYLIKWDTTGFAPTDRVSISLKDDYRNCIYGIVGCWTSFGIANTSNTGSYVWNTNLKISGAGGPNSMPVYTGGSFRISLTINSNNSSVSASDDSDGRFTIMPLFMQ